MKNTEAAEILMMLDLGSGVAENDRLLESARIETSVFDDLLADRVDLIPGTKGSGKSALYRIFVDFLPDTLLEQNKVILTHGVKSRQDTVFLAFKEQFDRLDESEFLDFWCIYLASLANDQFIKSEKYKELLLGHSPQVARFKSAYAQAKIPEFKRNSSLKEIISWSLDAVKKLKPKLKWSAPSQVGQFELELGYDLANEVSSPKSKHNLPILLSNVVDALDKLLDSSDLSLWLMVDKLDELFARRSATERKALRALLSSMRIFSSDRIRIKVFLRDDILEQIVLNDGFTALSHIADRRSDTLRWSEAQILSMVVRRIYSNSNIREKFQVNEGALKNDPAYQEKLFYKIFEDTVYRPPNQSKTLRWIYNHTKDGRGVVTPRDVITLLTRAFQWQRDHFKQHPENETTRLISGTAIIYGLTELSKEKRTVYLEAEFPHKWEDISKLLGGGSEFNMRSLKRIYGKRHLEILEDLVSLGIFEKTTRKGERTFKVPYIYRAGLELTQKFTSA